jgi:hypothetical protein
MANDAAHRRTKQIIVKITLVTSHPQHRPNLRPMPGLMKQNVRNGLPWSNGDHRNHQILFLRYIPFIRRKGFDKFLQTVPALAAKLKLFRSRPSMPGPSAISRRKPVPWAWPSATVPASP